MARHSLTADRALLAHVVMALAAATRLGVKAPTFNEATFTLLYASTRPEWRDYCHTYLKAVMPVISSTESGGTGANRSAAAKRAWRTRKQKEEAAAAAKRSAAAKRAWAKRRAAKPKGGAQ